MTFINEDFLLQSESAKHLYHDYAKDMPIFDYHCHLVPQQIAEDYAFENITELWLGGDHYKWRAMRAMGIPEEKITGNASAEEKFEAWAYTAENTVGNPLFHWTALELKKYFHIEELLTSKNWKKIYDECNRVLKEEHLTARTLINNSNVTFICTTDGPADSLEWHDAIKSDETFDVTVAPGFRPDEAFAIQDPAKFTGFIEKMKTVTGTEMTSFAELLAAMEGRIQYFADHGSNVSDHGLSQIYYSKATDEEIDSIYAKAINKEAISEQEYAKYQTKLFVALGKIYHAKGFVMQLHFGAIRNNNKRLFAQLGADVGVDSIQDQPNVSYALNNLLGAMDANNQLPKFIAYNLDPTYFDLVGTAITNFQANDEGIKSKVQMGSGWWFNDTKYGMLKQLMSLSEAGLLMNFVGMLTDSRSFISYTRHEYFRRILCDYVGDLVERGEIPNDDDLLEKLITNVCYNNAAAYFDFKK